MSPPPKTPPIHSSIEEAVEAFAAAANGLFELTAAADAVASTLRDLPGDLVAAVDDALQACPLLFQDAEPGRYVPRAIFFQGSRFLVQPTALETARKILIPGHRFIPFCTQDVFPPNCRLHWGDGRAAPSCTIQLPFDEIGIFLTLFGVRGMLDYLVTDDDANQSLLNAPPSPDQQFTLTAFDLSELFASQGFAEGDALRCTVDDWREGAYSIERVPAASLRTEAILRERWCRALDESLLAVFDDLGPSIDVHEQLAQAFARGPDWLAQSAPIHIGGYLAQSMAVEIHPVAMQTVLWKKGEDPDVLASAGARIAGRVPTGRCDGLTPILEELGLAVSEDEIEACMRDSLWKGTDDLDHVVGRILQGRETIAFYDRRQADAFFRFLGERWQDVRTSYNRAADAPAGALRSRLLDVLDRQIGLLRECDRRFLDFEDLPRDESVELSQLTALIAQLLAILNRNDVSDQELAELGGMADEMIDRFDRLLATVLAALPEGSPTDLRVLRQQDDRPDAILQLKVTLKGIRPPIWRRIQVHDDITLDELSEIINAAMGWHGGHLHAFRIGNREFGLLLQDELLSSGMFDETDVPLLRWTDGKGAKFRYQYDFGDDWNHDVLIEDVLPPEVGVDYPRCIKGRRACPPEDCGGIPGYQELLAVLADPAHPDHAELKSCLRHNFAPDTFNLKLANTHITECWHEFCPNPADSR